MNFQASVVVPTYDRPQELDVCLRSLLRQTVLPSELIIVDDGNLPAPPLRQEFEEAGVAYQYIRKDKPGLTESRNAGVAAASGDIIFFFDDDVELYSDYLEKALAVYTADPSEKIAGVGGMVANCRPMVSVCKIRWLFNLLFLNSGFREGTILPSGFCVNYGQTPFPLQKVRAVDFLNGCACSYREWVFREMSFTNGYRSIALGEDKDFSGRLSRRYTLMITPKAKLNHFEAQPMRPEKREWGRKTVLGRYLFFKAVAKQSWRHRICFYYALTGYMIMRTGIAVISFDRQEYARVLGILEAYWMILRGRVPELNN